MLVLTRTAGDLLLVEAPRATTIKVKIVRVNGRRVQVGIEAPYGVAWSHRARILAALKRRKFRASSQSMG